MGAIETGLHSSLSHDMAAIFGQVYRCNGWNRMSVWDGFTTSALRAGISEPASYSAVARSTAVSAGQGMSPGTHFFRFRYANSKTQYVSNPTAPVEFVAKQESAAATGAKYTFSNILASPDSKVDRIVAEVTDAGGAVFFKATVVANQNQAIPVRADDDTLRSNPIFWDDFGHDIPPYFQHVEAFRGRLWGFGQVVYATGTAKITTSGVAVSGVGTKWTSAAKGMFLLLSGDQRRYIASVVSQTDLRLDQSAASKTVRNYQIIPADPDSLFFSKALFPESWPPENKIRTLDGKPEKLRSAKGYRQDLIIYGERSMQRLVYGEDPFQDGALEPIEGERGAASRLCTQDVGGAIYSLDYKGIHRYAGGPPEHMSEALDPYFDPADTSQGYVDFSYRSTFHSVHYPARHQILWFVVMQGLPGDSTSYTKPQHAIVYDYLNGTFTLYTFDVAMVASTVGPGSNGTSQTILADENGRLWVFGIGSTDGLHPQSPVTVHAASGATATSVPLSDATGLYTGGSGLAGAMAYWVEGNALGRITTNSASGFVLVSPGFATAPAKGDTIHLGRIPSKWKSKAFILRNPEDAVEYPLYLNIHYEPKDEGSIRVRFYINRSASAFVDWSENYLNRGVSLDTDNNYYEVDITDASGNAAVPLPSGDDDTIHTIEFEIEIVSATAFEMAGFSIDGYVEEED